MRYFFVSCNGTYHQCSLYRLHWTSDYYTVFIQYRKDIHHSGCCLCQFFSIAAVITSFFFFVKTSPPFNSGIFIISVNLHSTIFSVLLIQLKLPTIPSTIPAIPFLYNSCYTTQHKPFYVLAQLASNKTHHNNFTNK